ncbi:UDP-N-acetylmuramoyl-L-alanyl-D-glutamate--2, 6-diaminopimelate ligase [Candidatus Desulfarcum epimagneticum]|uniref:UDP-N-acetylmuramoyl-L-alanyl-D-glutamate--2,6-diaminopimelate ligase n=1 Tax=uncultured Desulfobacteraceae bacterium TaxID=218296 RepID=A0A484HJ27_9BACT|nr:UDP-N-acetylmuramoyl-L-alanyl-D-glutamate--2, 6-diaminopimelate ligase [uncultured Desulfobacteraceae bacterium]
MKLSRLIRRMDSLGLVAGPFPEKDPDVGAIHHRSGDVRPGGLFVAVPGFLSDGHDHIVEALDRGAAAVAGQRSVIEKKKILIPGTPLVQTEDSRKALGAISAEFYGDPSKSLKVIGITGTNGKTTTSFILESVLKAAGLNPGVIGTVDCRYMGRTIETRTTTPESADLQRMMAEMLKGGATHVVLEVSSHAVDLSRIFGCRFDAGVFTNLTRDHLDYHKTMDGYWRCKKRFFTDFIAKSGKKDSAAIINRRDPRGRELFRELGEGVGRPRLVSTGFGEGDMVRPLDFEIHSSGISGRAAVPGGSFALESGLAGRHNLENILCAAGAAHALGIPPRAMEEGIRRLKSAPGRLERVENDRGLFIYVDYAHTPDALENVLSTLKNLGTGRLVCVFGCGGDRDVEKRPMMGRISGRLADLSIITSDNPRTEDPDRIMAHVEKGAAQTCPKMYDPGTLKRLGFSEKGRALEPDREKAIRLAIDASRPGDVILIAGKGHEDYQIIGDKKIPFDDKKKVLEAIGGPGAGGGG